MKKTYVFLYLSILCGCANKSTPNLLNKRADYTGQHQIEKIISEQKGPFFGKKRGKIKSVNVLVHPHKLHTGDHFLGGWIRLYVRGAQ